MWEKNESLPQKLKDAQTIKNPILKNKKYIQLLTEMLNDLGGTSEAEVFSFNQILFSISNIWGESTDIFSDDLEKIETKDDFISLLNRMLKTLKENDSVENISSKAINKVISIYQQQIEVMKEQQQLSQRLKTATGKYNLLVSMIETFIHEYHENYKGNLRPINDRPEVKQLDNEFTSLDQQKNRIRSEITGNPKNQSLQGLNYQLDNINNAIENLEEIKERLSLRLDAINKIIETNRAAITPQVEIITKTTKVLDNFRSTKEVTKEQEAKVREARAKSQQAAEELNKYISTIERIEKTIQSYPNLDDTPLVAIDSKVSALFETGQKLIAGKNDILNKGFPENPQKQIAILEGINRALGDNIKNLQEAIITAENERQFAAELALEAINKKIEDLLEFNKKIATNPSYSAVVNLEEINNKVENVKKGASQLKDYSMQNIVSAQSDAILLLNRILKNEDLKNLNNSFFTDITMMRQSLDNLEKKKSGILKNVVEFDLGTRETELKALENLSPKAKDSYDLFDLNENKLKELSSAIQKETEKADSYEIQIKVRASSQEIGYVKALLDEIDKAKNDRTAEIKEDEISKDPIIKILNHFSSLLIRKRDSYLNVVDINTSRLEFIDDFVSTMNTVITEKDLQKLTDTTSNVFVDFVNVVDSIIESIKSFIAEKLDKKTTRKSTYKPQFWPSEIEQKMVSNVATTFESLQSLQENLQQTVNTQNLKQEL
jgi:DNA repair exonuclease SbcCD ATPase subunit